MFQAPAFKPLPRYLLTIAYDGRFFLGWQRQSSDSFQKISDQKISDQRVSDQRVSAISSEIPCEIPCESTAPNVPKSVQKHLPKNFSKHLLQSVQATLEEAVFRFSQQKATLHAAGRTDQGVHALAQQAHLDLDLSRYDTTNRAHEELLRDAVNFHLKSLPVVVKKVQAVSSSFHARFSATRREYLYRIVVSPTRPIFREGGVWHRMTNARSQQRWGKNLEAGLARLRRSAQELLGEHDFQAFRSSACQARSSVKRMYKAEVTRDDDEIRLVFQASGFLYRQVRLMTGTLLAIAEQRLPEDSVRRLLKEETLASSLPPPRFAAPSQGLYFAGATYDDLSTFSSPRPADLG